MGPAEFEQLLLQGQGAIVDKTTRTGETTHWMPLALVRPAIQTDKPADELGPAGLRFLFATPRNV
jgi:hypothetical protein